tara:strand:- start:31 stop:450 length:420 start_codon:yes stop_codon:yes gene_type:complete
MKNLNSVILLLVLICLTIGCSDGQDGKVFLRIRALLEEPTDSVRIDNSDIPEDFVYNTYYEISPGTYTYSYIDFNDEAHPKPGEFPYIDIVAEPGSESSLLKHGEPGSDLYIDFWLLSDGAVVQSFNYKTVAEDTGSPE